MGSFESGMSWGGTSTEGESITIYKQWVLDQVVHALLGDGYSDWVDEYEDGDDEPNTRMWDEGIAP